MECITFFRSESGEEMWTIKCGIQSKNSIKEFNQRIQSKNSIKEFNQRIQSKNSIKGFLSKTRISKYENDLYGSIKCDFRRAKTLKGVPNKMWYRNTEEWNGMHSSLGVIYMRVIQW